MKARRIFSVCLSLFALMTLMSFSAMAESYDFKNSGIHDGLVDANTATVTDNVTIKEAYLGFLSRNVTTTLIEGKDDNSSTASVELKHNSLGSQNILFNDGNADRRYVVYSYYYAGSKTDIRPTLTLKKKAFNFVPKEDTKTAYAMDVLSPAQAGDDVNSKVALKYIIFDIGDFMGADFFPGGSYPEMIFNPFGDTPASELDSSDKIYLAKIMFLKESELNINAGSPTKKYPVIFTSGRADAYGEDPEIQFAAEGDGVMMPDNPYILEGYTFGGWVCADGNADGSNDVYSPGSTKNIVVKSLYNGAYSRSTGRTYFVAKWIPNGPEFKSEKYYSFARSSTGTYLENRAELDGILTSKYSITGTGDDPIALKSQNWNSGAMPVNLRNYKKCAVLYYWNTNKTNSEYTPVLKFLRNTTNPELSALKTEVSIGANSGYLKANQWAIMEFEFDFVGAHKNYITDDYSILRELEIRPFNGTAAKKLTGDEIYIADIVFFSKEARNITFNNSYIQGVDDTHFSPAGELTEAQAAAIIARYLGYAEGVTTGTHAEYLISKGVMKSGEGTSSNPCKRSDFIGYLINAASGNTGATTVGTISGSSDETITRAEAVALVNSIFNYKNFNKNEVEFIGDKEFSDIEKNDWYGPDVLLASTDLIYYKNSTGKTIVCAYPNKNALRQNVLDTSDAEIAELDTRTNNRIAEIRGTASSYVANGTVYCYYTGNSAGTAPDGAQTKKIASLDEVPTNFKPGDVVLFKRGDVFTGTLTTVNGVTYSAYGSGAKPMFVNTPVDRTSGTPVSAAGDPDNWTLVSGTTNIWKYTDETLRDVGAINLFTSGSAFSDDPEITVAYKVCPNFNGNFIIDDVTYNSGSPVAFLEKALTKENMFFHAIAAGDGGYPTTSSTGPLYLRCDDGNPASVYSDITFNGEGHLITSIAGGNKNVTIDNICIKYFGSHGISTNSPGSYVVRNCEIGWGGGSLHGTMSWNANAGAYVFGRFGNGVEFYGSVHNSYIENCYVYELYDAGITHQIAKSESNIVMEGVYYEDNVLVNSTYNIEYFVQEGYNPNKSNPITRFMKDIYFTDNILRGAGYGWGVQRPYNGPSNIMSWVHNNLATDFVIENNIIDRCINLNPTLGHSASFVIEIYAGTNPGSAPCMINNTVIQAYNRHLMRQGDSAEIYGNGLLSEKVLNDATGKGNVIKLCSDDTSEHSGKLFWK